MIIRNQVFFLLSYYDKKLGPQLLGIKYLNKPGMPSFSNSVLQNITTDSLLTHSNPLILYIKDKEQNPYIVQIKKFSNEHLDYHTLFDSSVAVIFFIPKSNSNAFPLPIRREFIRRIYHECQCTESAEYFVFNFNLELDDYLNTIKSQNVNNGVKIPN